MKAPQHRFATPLALVLSVFLAAAIGSQFEPGAWYDALRKPSWTPPGPVFGVVWAVLYTAIAVVGWRLAMAAPSANRTAALLVFLLQLGFNAAWSALFFGLQWPLGAFVDIWMLWLSTTLLVILAAGVDRLSSFLLTPYLCWISFALVINGSIVMMN